MAGSGRKSAYRKTITDEVLYGEPEPQEGQIIVQVQSLRGTNMFEVATPEGMTGLARLPTKFRKLIWIRRGDYVIVSGSSEDYLTKDGKEGAVKYNIEQILTQDQIKSLYKKNLWPPAFENAVPRRHTEQPTTGVSEALESLSIRTETYKDKEEEEEAYETESEDDDDDLFVNRNRENGGYGEVEDTDDESDDEDI